MSSRNHVIDGVQIPTGRENFGERGAAQGKVQGRSTYVNCAKTDEPIEMPFGKLSQVDPRNHVTDGSAGAPTGSGTTVRGMHSPLQSIGFRGIE